MSTTRPHTRSDLVQSVSVEPSLLSLLRQIYTWFQVGALKRDITCAREEAVTLTGGDQLVEDQDEIIEMLTRLRQRKRYVYCRLLSTLAFVSVGLRLRI